MALKASRQIPSPCAGICRVLSAILSHRRAPPGATPLDLLEQAKQAARLPDLLARVTSVNGGGGERAVPQWDELRVWDPGD